MADLGVIEGLPKPLHQEGIWNFDDDDFLLAAILQDPVYAAEVLWEDPANREYGGCYRVRDFQYPLFRTFDNYAGFACARSVGKALADGSPVLTTQGYRPIQTLRVGDLVIGSDGYPTPVLGVYPQGEREVWRVRFSDGAEVDCDDDHLWTVTCDSWQTRGSGPRTLPVRELRTRKARFKVQLPSGPVEFARLPDPDVDPWAVGALIGDGNLSRPTMIRFASVDDENVTRLAAAIGEDAELVHEGGCNYRIRGREAVYAGWGGRQPCNLLRWTRERGLQGKLAHEKRVPHEYLWGSVETRLQVLRGLADTDGSVTHSGSVEISTASEGLAHDIRHLALSLGGRASIRRGPTSHRDRFRVVFRLPSHNPFCLTRKHSAYAKRNRQRSRDCDWRGIKEINRVGHRPATCIEVAAEDGLFMAADMVLTHNTESIKAKAFTHAFRRQRENLLVTAPELIHLLPLTDAIEERIRDTRLTREFLDLRGGQTGFTHRPFGVNYRDGTKIVGRIPRLTGPQPLDAKVATPTGWVTMADVRPGDSVLTPDGGIASVSRVEEGESEVYEITFTDGSCTRVGADHEWLVADPRIVPKQWEWRTTDEIRDDLTDPKRSMWQVPSHRKIEFTETPDLPLDPYVLGVLLGDGGFSTHSIFFTSADPEIVGWLEDALPAGAWVVSDRREYRYRIRGKGGSARNPVVTALRDLGLLGTNSGTKFIPSAYMHATPEQRLALLQGLVDTDGTVSKEGKVVVALKNPRLVGQIAELVRSLGGWASITTQVTKPYDQMLNGVEYHNRGGEFPRVTIVLDEPPCRLPRKKLRLRGRTRPRVRSIKSVELVGRRPVKCFRIDTPDHLYLTDDYIPTGQTGVKGQHQPDLLIDEAQDYPERGWVEVHETVMKDDPTFTYHFYGVHSGARDSGFYKRINEGGFKVVQVTAMQRPGWNASEKQAAKAAYGGTSAPDYRRNIIGEAGAAASAFFVTARLVACLDQDRESHYNQMGYVHQELRVEEVDELGVPLAEVMDLPSDYGKVWAGMDVGLTNSPTVISLFSHEKIKMGKEPPRDRLKLIRRYTIERFRSRQIREAMYVIAWHLGDALQGFGVDATGLGFPIFQEMEDDEACPQHLRNVTRGYFFNSKLPVDVEQRFITEDGQGRMRDQYGAAVKTEEDPLTGHRRYVTYQTMIEASTRYLREMVDSQFLLLPFDTEITTDMQGETVQRVTTVARLTGAKKPNAFHILDSFRAAVMPFRGEEVEKALEIEPPSPVLDMLL